MKTVPQDLRDTAIQRLSAAAQQALQRLHSSRYGHEWNADCWHCSGRIGRNRFDSFSYRLFDVLIGMHSVDVPAIAKSLEMECFQKHGKSGRPFYNSQVASTVRWLSTCNWEEFRARTSVGSSTLGALANEQKPAQPTQRVPEASELQQISRVESSVATTPTKVANLVTDLATADHAKPAAVVASAALPRIPSFSDYLSKKRAPSSSLGEQLFSGPRKKFKPPLMTKK